MPHILYYIKTYTLYSATREILSKNSYLKTLHEILFLKRIYHVLSSVKKMYKKKAEYN